MITELEEAYEHVRSGGGGFHEQKRGLVAVWGKEAVQFLDGLITNDMKTLADDAQMLAAFPNAQGRLIAIVRVLRQGDRFLIETEDATCETVFKNLFRFTYAGDFFVKDLSGNYRYFEIFGPQAKPPASAGGVTFTSNSSSGHFIEADAADVFRSDLTRNESVQIADDLYEILRIESGVPKYGVDMDETTIVPELGLDGLISYNKGCYIGQEIIARIHFRGHVAKQLTGLLLDDTLNSHAADFAFGAELVNVDGKNAGKVASVVYSPKLGKTISLAFVRYDYLKEGTVLNCGERQAVVKGLPFFD